MVLRFDIITEADARQIERGATVELSKGGHVTPLAQDTLRERRVTVVPAGSVDAALPADLAPRSEIRRVAIASDHTGVKMRAAIVQHLRGKGIAVDDLGVDGSASVVIDGAGIGSAIAANKVRGVRAAMITDETIARYAREHNGTNVMTLGSTLLPDNQTAIRLVDIWLGTPMTEARYIRRLLKIRRMEESF